MAESTEGVSRQPEPDASGTELPAGGQNGGDAEGASRRDGPTLTQTSAGDDLTVAASRRLVRRNSVEQAISRVTGEFQAYTDALAAMINKKPQPSAVPGKVENAEAPQQRPASEALAALIRNKPQTSELAVHAKHREPPPPELPPESLPWERLTPPDEPASSCGPSSVRKPRKDESLMPSEKGAVEIDAAMPCEQGAVETDAARPCEQGAVEVESPLVSEPAAPPVSEASPLPPPVLSPPQGSPGGQTGFQRLVNRTARAVRRTTGEIQVYGQALARLVRDGVRQESPTAAGTVETPADRGTSAGEAGAHPAGEPSGLISNAGRAFRRSTGEIHNLREKLAELVAETRCREEEKELQRRESLDPAKLQCIEKYKYASLCPSKWDQMSGGDQYRLCNLCGLFAYDFSRQNVAEAERIVFQREGVSNPTFYRRQDGRFLSQDCPLGIRNRQRRLQSAAVLLVILGGVVALGWFLASQRPPVTVQAPAVAPVAPARRDARPAALTGRSPTPGTPATTPSPSSSASGAASAPGDALQQAQPGQAPVVPQQLEQAPFALPQPEAPAGDSGGSDQGNQTPMEFDPSKLRPDG